MKNLILPVLFVIMAFSAAAQDTAEKRDLRVTVRDERGRIIKDPKIEVFLNGGAERRTPDETGDLFFRITDLDVLNVAAAGSDTKTLSLRGLSFVDVILKDGRKLAKGEDPVYISYGMETLAVEGDMRNFKLSVRNEKGKGIAGVDLYAFKTGEPGEVITMDRNGNRFIRVTDADTLNLKIGGQFYELPLLGLDSVLITMKNQRDFLRAQGVANEKMPAGYGGVVMRETNPHSVDFEKMTAANETYPDLISYIRGRFSGLYISGGEVIIRGGIPSLSGYTAPALIVVDDIQYFGKGDISMLNNILHPRDIESITILKDSGAAIYGVKAAGGAVVIYTKRPQMLE